jgi:hypothetical protein
MRWDDIKGVYELDGIKYKELLLFLKREVYMS